MQPRSRGVDSGPDALVHVTNSALRRARRGAGAGAGAVRPGWAQRGGFGPRAGARSFLCRLQCMPSCQIAPAGRPRCLTLASAPASPGHPRGFRLWGPRLRPPCAPGPIVKLRHGRLMAREMGRERVEAKDAVLRRRSARRHGGGCSSTARAGVARRRRPASGRAAAAAAVRATWRSKRRSRRSAGAGLPLRVCCSVSAPHEFFVLPEGVRTTEGGGARETERERGQACAGACVGRGPGDPGPTQRIESNAITSWPGARGS
jgi:hypothetical protein